MMNFTTDILPSRTHVDIQRSDTYTSFVNSDRQHTTHNITHTHITSLDVCLNQTYGQVMEKSDSSALLCPL